MFLKKVFLPLAPVFTRTLLMNFRHAVRITHSETTSLRQTFRAGSERAVAVLANVQLPLPVLPETAAAAAFEFYCDALVSAGDATEQLPALF
ncbi:MAG: hypothetical protein ACKOEO_18575 [Planctomycetaceae bacterium]